MIPLKFSPSRPTMADGAGEASPQGQATLQPGAEEAEQQQEELAWLGLRGRDGQTRERWPERRQLKHLTGSLQEAARWFEARQMKQRALMRSRNRSRASSRPQRSCLESRLLWLLRRPSRRIEWGLTSPFERLRHQYGFLIASCESVGRRGAADQCDRAPEGRPSGLRFAAMDPSDSRSAKKPALPWL